MARSAELLKYTWPGWHPKVEAAFLRWVDKIMLPNLVGLRAPPCLQTVVKVLVKAASRGETMQATLQRPARKPRPAPPQRSEALMRLPLGNWHT